MIMNVGGRGRAGGVLMIMHVGGAGGGGDGGVLMVTHAMRMHVTDH